MSKATKIYKTVKYVHESGMGAEIDFGYRIKQFKCKNGCEHHNHLVCVNCDEHFYIDSEDLENIQDHLSRQNHFIPLKHNFKIFGLCQNCTKAT